ncbi:MAG: hypothetical protein DMG15_05680 [Acidobacteria bacterium]|nr:MAG: hypothetical protein DMG15_05680 [Acidobacteriota bacterium]
MLRKQILFVVPFLLLGLDFVALGQQRNAIPQKPDNPQSLVHVDTAKKLAGNDAFLLKPFNFYCPIGAARANSQTAPDLEPVKIFDNLYAIGNSETTTYVLPTSEGLVLIDSGFENKVESTLVPHLQKLGFDPAKVKYILLGHGHADHFGGSKYFQDKYGTRVGTTAADWDLIYPPNPPANQNQGKNAPPARPKKDLVLAEGQPFKSGELTITPIAIPGQASSAARS